MIGQTLSHYRITDKLGTGGMGEVYKARDERLDRDVAVKVLREDLASDPERLRRFEQEARAASALNHPNIITIHEIGKHEGTPYIAMEYVEGNTLRELVSEGPLAAEKLLRYATQIAEGLAKAHSAGIIHRDLKPENLMVTSDGYVKILDFGLAKLLPQSRIDSKAATITKEGTVAGAVIGTASYMSPEQALGKPLDARTDVFSFGSVLYEMATGRKAFQGETTAGLFNAILNKTPTSPRRLNPELPEKLERVVEKALQKDPGLRHQTAKEMLEDLKRTNEPAALSKETSIVVLPFEDISPNRDNEYFSDGLTEEVIADLSQVPEIRVISRNSAMILKGTKKTTEQIHKELRVQYVLEGSVRKVGNGLRITAQLIDAEKDVHLWAQKYSGTLDDVFDIQEKVSRSIVDALKLKLTPEAERQIAKKNIKNVQAYECYLKARQEILLFTDDALGRAIELIRNGLDISGDNALLYAGLGFVYWQFLNAGIKPAERDAYIKKTEDCAAKALALDPTSPQGHLLQGLIGFQLGKPQLSTHHLKRALVFAPDDPDVLFWLAFTYSFSGKEHAAWPLVNKLLEVDPLTAFNVWIPGWLYLMEGRLEATLEPCQRAYEMEPENLIIRYACAIFLAANRRLEEACSMVDSMKEDAPESALAQSAVFFKHALRNDRTAALQAMTSELQTYANYDDSIGWLMAGSYSLLGMKEEALDRLQYVTSRCCINYPFLSKHDPFLQNLRGERRFRQIMEKTKSTWERFEV